MRASKRSRSRFQDTSISDGKFSEEHISGAEGMYEEKEISKVLRQYTHRALTHQKGRPDNIVISIEEIRQRPQSVLSLPIRTLICSSNLLARSLVRKLLIIAGISERAINSAFALTDSAHSMRGAALIRSGSGQRVEPDMERGIRVSRLGISRPARLILSRRLSRQDINNSTVKEAIILASKVAACNEVTAELCISDDPEYTTGYISSGKLGYLRIPHLKKKGGREGGRVFFLGDNADIGRVKEFLEKTPVIINSVSPCLGLRTIDEIIDHINR